MTANKKLSGAELRALREQLDQTRTDPAAEAARRESSFLRSMDAARDDLAWIGANQAWVHLGHDTFVGWWIERVQPVMDALSVKATPELARKVIDLVVEEQKALPPAQRHTKRELAELVGVSEWTARARQDPRQRRSAAGSDLESPPTEGTAAEVPPAADGEPASSAPPPAAGVGAPQEAGRPAPAVNPTETPGDSRSGGEGDVEGSSPAAPPPTVEGSTPGDETEAEVPADASPQQDAAEVDGWEQQETAGVTDPAAPTPDQPVQLIEWMADLYDLVDTDVHGPLLTDEELRAIGASLDRISGVVELLTTWYLRAQQQ